MLPTERSMNYVLRLPERKSNFPITIPVSLGDINKNEFDNINVNNNYCFSKPWNSDSFTLLDVIVQEILKKYYITYNHTSIPSNPTNSGCGILLNQNNINQSIHLIIPDSELSIRETTLFMNYPFLNSYNIYNILTESLCNNKILIPYYNVRYSVQTNKGLKFPYTTYIPNNPEIFLELNIVEEKDKKNKVKDRLYTIMFKSTLSKYFYSNCISLNIDFFNETFYNLPIISQLIFRLFISHAKITTIQKTTGDIAKKIGLNLENSSYYNKVIEKHLQILKENKFILNFKYVRSKFCYVIIENNLKLKDRGYSKKYEGINNFENVTMQPENEI